MSKPYSGIEDSESIRDRMVKKYLVDKVDLFRYSPCIIPGWEKTIDKAIAVVEQWNDKNKDNKVKFFQIKKKWSKLVIYLERYTEDDCKDGIPHDIQLKIDSISKEAEKFCLHCGKEKIETVKETKIVFECFEHWDSSRY
jgi:hypothetical protein